MTEKEKKEKIETVIVKSPDEQKRLLNEGIKKTMFPAFIGLFFAFIFFYKFKDATGVSWFSILLLVVLVSFYIQKLLYPSIGVRVNEFETKDWLYVELFVIVYFLVFWTLLLNV